MDNGLWTEKFSDEPISGKVYEYFGEESNPKKVYMGNMVNGKKEGEWKSYYSNGKNITIISKMVNQMDYKLIGMKMDRRNMRKLTRMENRFLKNDGTKMVLWMNN